MKYVNVGKIGKYDQWLWKILVNRANNSGNSEQEYSKHI